MCDDSDHVLSELSDSAFDLPALEFEEDDVDLDEALVPALKKKRDILIEVNDYFKKVITLDNEQDLKSLFRIAIFKDPGLRHYSYVPFKFQIFSQKFSTWVDLDCNDVPNLKDGTHLKAVFRCDDKSNRHSKHKHKSKRRDSSPQERRKKRKLSKRHRVSSGEEYEVRSSKRSRTSYSSDEGRSLVTTTVLDEPNNTPYRARNRQRNLPKQYNLCSVSSTTFTVSATNYVVSSSKHVKYEAYNEIDNDVEEGEMRDEDNKDSENFNETVPASEGKIYKLSLGLEWKNPISALHELCTKMQCDPPTFEVLQDGKMPNPQFLIQVTVRGKSYIPDAYARRKKEAKKLAAEYCLKQMGYL